MSGLSIERSCASRERDASARASPAMSRTVVTSPRSAMPRRRSVRGRESSPDGSVATCTWVSISPGITNRPASCMMLVPPGSGPDPVGKIAAIRSPSMRIVECGRGSPATSSMSVTSTSAVRGLATCAGIVAPRRDAMAAPSNTSVRTRVRHNRNRFIYTTRPPSRQRVTRAPRGTPVPRLPARQRPAWS